MKFYLFLFLIICSSSDLFSQYFRCYYVERAEFDISIRKMFDDDSNEIYLDETEGSPFLNEKFASGVVSDNSKHQNYGLQVRYNVFYDEIEIYDKERNTMSVLLKLPEYTCNLNNQYFQYFNFKNGINEEVNGYFIELIKGEMKLFMKYDCSFSAGKPSLNTLTPDVKPSFTISKNYYVLKDEVLVQIPKKKKKVLTLFGDYQKGVSAYITKNKLNVKKERDIVKIISFYNSLVE